MKNIGDIVYWVEASCNYQKQIPCPMCFGKKIVTIILGNDSQEQIECGFCIKGFERPSGYATTWEANAVIHSGTITGISTKDGCRYEVGYHNIFQHETYDTLEQAELVRQVKLDEVIEQAKQWHLDNFKRAKQKQIWSAGYHRNQIKDAERTIEWHRDRLGMIKAKAKEGSAE